MGIGIFFIGSIFGGLMLKTRHRGPAGDDCLPVGHVARSSLTPVAGPRSSCPELGIIDRDELPGVSETLDAAALTYLAAFVASLGNLLYLLTLLNGGRRND